MTSGTTTSPAPLSSRVTPAGAQVIARIRQNPQVPAPSQTVTRILGLTNNPDCDMSKVAELIQRDAGLTATLLRQANSVLMGASRVTSSIREACVRLGMKRVRAAVLNDHVVGGLAKAKPPGFDANKYWQAALATSVAAGDLAKKLCPARLEDAGTAGLLCDLGIGLLAYGLPNYKAVLAKISGAGAVGLERIEKMALGLTHADAGAAVMEDWKLDAHMIDAVRCHHDDPDADLPSGGAKSGAADEVFIRIVGAAATCSQIALSGSEMELVERLFAQIGRVSPKPDALVATILDELVAHVQQTADAMAVELGSTDEMASNFADAVKDIPNVGQGMSFRPMDRHHFDRE